MLPSIDDCMPCMSVLVSRCNIVNEALDTLDDLHVFGSPPFSPQISVGGWSLGSWTKFR